MVNSRFTDNGDVRIHYLDSGDDDDRDAPIVFVPGMTDIADDYIEVMPLFGRRTVVVELRGHGKSGAPVSGYDLTTLSGDFGAVVDAVTDGPIHMVTFSRGTSYAVAWALAHPDRVLSLAIGDYTPEERVLPPGVSYRLLSGRWRGSPVHERLNTDAANKTFRAACAVGISVAALCNAGGRPVVPKLHSSRPSLALSLRGCSLAQLGSRPRTNDSGH